MWAQLYCYYADYQSFQALMVPYKTKNACSNTPSFLCIITILVYLALIALHIVYILTPIVGGVITQNPILYILLALHFALLICVLYDYIWIASHDPVDRIIHDPALAINIDQAMLTECKVCGQRLLGSHHCKECGRCTEQFDHHCRYLNNCIGSKNYEKFLRLLLTNVLFHSNLIGQGIWVFVRALEDDKVSKVIPRTYWVILGIIGISGALLISIIILLSFHCYISCFLHQTTLDYLFGGNKTKKVSNIRLTKESYVETERQLS